MSIHIGVALAKEKSLVVAAPGPAGRVFALTVAAAGPSKPLVRTSRRNICTPFSSTV